LLLTAVPSIAGLVTFSTQGVFLPTVPVSNFTFPNQTFEVDVSFAYDYSTTVATLANVNWHSPASVDVSPVFFNWLLNASSVPQLAPDTILYDTSAGGGLELNFGGGNSVRFTGPQLFSGPTSDPSPVFGAFVDDGSGGTLDGVFVNSVNVQPLTGATVNAVDVVPEPGSLLLASPVLLLLLRRRVGRHRST